jgi:hypothetical protein
MLENVFEDESLLSHLRTVKNKRKKDTGKAVTVDDLKKEALQKYFLREGLTQSDIDIVFSSVIKINGKVRELASQRGASIVSVFEQAYREFCVEEISKKPVERKPMVTEKKKSSFFDLNAGVQRK